MVMSHEEAGNGREDEVGERGIFAPQRGSMVEEYNGNQ